MKDYSSIVISSEVRLLRNLNGFLFTPMLDGDEGKKVLNKVADTILKIDDDYKFYKISTLPELDVNVMLEKKLITNNLVDSGENGASILSSKEDVLFLINESDHIVEKCKIQGLNLINAYDKINEIDNKLLANLDIAYDDSIGFLTSDIKNIGTGLKASITLFLPALTLSGKIKDIILQLSNQGFEFVFNQGEVDSNAYTYTICNSQTIGRRETDFVVRVTEVALKLCEMEIFARKDLLLPSSIDDIKDKIFRAWGILTNCYKIDVLECEKLLSEIKIGVALDIVRFKDVNFIDNLMIDVLPYSLTKISGSKVTISELDKYRANFVANILKTKRIK